jgi:hypothetical protein
MVFGTLAWNLIGNNTEDGSGGMVQVINCKTEIVFSRMLLFIILKLAMVELCTVSYEL